MIGWSWIVVWLGCLTVSAAQLPPEILVDKYLLQAQILSEEKNHKDALEAMDRIVALQKEHDLTLPEAFPFHYAQTSLAAGSVQAAIDSANRYLSTAGNQGKSYREALELLQNAERRLSVLSCGSGRDGGGEAGNRPVIPISVNNVGAGELSGRLSLQAASGLEAVDARKSISRRLRRIVSKTCLEEGAEQNLWS